MIYVILYILSGIATTVYILGNMCLSDLEKYPNLYPTKEAWMEKSEHFFAYPIGLFVGPFHLIMYRLGYQPCTWKWTNPWSVK